MSQPPFWSGLYGLPLVNKVLARIPPHPQWKYQPQTTPPTFGWAQAVSRSTLDQEVEARRPYCEEALRKYSQGLVSGQVDLVVLSCKRWDTLERTIASFKQYFSQVDTYPKLHKVLVDNGSGPELIEKAKATGFFDHIIPHPHNLGMVGALRLAYEHLHGEYVLLLEDDFLAQGDDPFLEGSIELFKEYPEIGIIRLKDQNNWWKPHRRIAPLRETSSGEPFWTWLPSKDGTLNGWCAGSVMFRKAAYLATGHLPEVNTNPERNSPAHQGYIYECTYGREFNARWLAAKPEYCPFFQPNDNDASTGWGS